MIFDILIDFLLTILLYKGTEVIVGDYVRAFRRIPWKLHLVCMPIVILATFGALCWVVAMVEKYTLIELLPSVLRQ